MYVCYGDDSDGRVDDDNEAIMVVVMMMMMS